MMKNALFYLNGKVTVTFSAFFPSEKQIETGKYGFVNHSLF